MITNLEVIVQKQHSGDPNFDLSSPTQCLLQTKYAPQLIPVSLQQTYVTWKQRSMSDLDPEFSGQCNSCLRLLSL